MTDLIWEMCLPGLCIWFLKAAYYRRKNPQGWGSWRFGFRVGFVPVLPCDRGPAAFSLSASFSRVWSEGLWPDEFWSSIPLVHVGLPFPVSTPSSQHPSSPSWAAHIPFHMPHGDMVRCPGQSPHSFPEPGVGPMGTATLGRSPVWRRKGPPVQWATNRVSRNPLPPHTDTPVSPQVSESLGNSQVLILMWSLELEGGGSDFRDGMG